MPSTHEAFGMMAIEAMSCGVPVISLKGTSLEKVTNAPECGICVEETNFAYELKKLISDKDELKARAIKSLEFARENYSIEKYINGMIEIYKDVIKNHQTLNEEESLLLSQLKKYIPKEKCTSIEKHWLYTKEKSENRRTIRFLGIKFSYKKSN
jgi:hypothetical protein